ncbi:MAG: methyltransferase domain-containing protein [Candidatus Pacearchaeota archaeon]
MVEKNKGVWEKIYKSTKGEIWKFKPHNITVRLTKLIPKGASVLDLGCGDGRDSVFLAKKGFKVTGIDVSKSAIKRLKDRARKEKVKIKTIIADLEKYRIRKNYDLIFSCVTFHLLKKSSINRIIKNMKEKTKQNGLNALFVFRKKGHELQKKNTYLGKCALTNYYRDWKIIHYKEFKMKDKHSGDPNFHYHYIAEIIARKK